MTANTNIQQSPDWSTKIAFSDRPKCSAARLFSVEKNGFKVQCETMLQKSLPNPRSPPCRGTFSSSGLGSPPVFITFIITWYIILHSCSSHAFPSLRYTTYKMSVSVRRIGINLGTAWSLLRRDICSVNSVIDRIFFQQSLKCLVARNNTFQYLNSSCTASLLQKQKYENRFSDETSVTLYCSSICRTVVGDSTGSSFKLNSFILSRLESISTGLITSVGW